MNKVSNEKVLLMEQNTKSIIRTKILKKIFELSENSTSHGIPSILRTNRLTIRILWTDCLLASISGCSYMVYKTISDYLNYETVSKIEYITELKSEFPTVSICMNNPFLTKESENLIL